ncbi:hypothetical protein F8388_020603 (mitochondrion) [Cannabis sativa]|uniref:Uncharacterized protein n=1 Tax=Cannabis sativa TaxID=3483 RepID=A0A7J6DQD4_CANSA|nr:hypothetical protein F8388_020603 [Cannabis sativa]
MLHESAAFSVVLSHSCPPRRATRSVVLSHKISTPPACWPGESKFSSGQLSTQSSAKNTVESRNARCWGLYWRDPTVNSCPKEKPPGSPRTFSTVPYPRTSSLRAKQDRPCPFPFSIPPPSFFVPIESKAKQKWFVCLLDERKRTSFPGLWIGFSQRHDIIKRKE